MSKKFLIPATIATCLTLTTFIPANASSLAGSWKGSGHVTSTTGLQERVRCNVQISKDSEKTYSMNAYCATTSGKVNQYANLRKIGRNKFKGSFYNKKKNTRGTIHITLRGNRYSMHMSSNRGSANVTMRRR